MKTVHGCFRKWWSVSNMKANKVGMIFATLFNRKYRRSLDLAVLFWRRGMRWKQLCSALSQDGDVCLTIDELKKDIKSLDLKIYMEQFRWAGVRERALVRTINLFNRRAQHIGIKRWHTQMMHKRWYELKNLLISECSRIVKLKSAFTKYADHVRSIPYENRCNAMIQAKL